MHGIKEGQVWKHVDGHVDVCVVSVDKNWVTIETLNTLGAMVHVWQIPAETLLSFYNLEGEIVEAD
jgi:hypothetical protein